MNEIQQEEQQIVVTQENIQELLTSKNFKQRILAYQSIQQFPQHIGILQNETLAVAIEAAVEALLSFDGCLKNEHICGLYAQLGQPKQSLRTKLSGLIDKVYLEDGTEVIHGIVQLFEHKNSKIVRGCVVKVRELVESDIDAFKEKGTKMFLLENVCGKLQALFSNADQAVRAETTTLTVALYKIFFNGLLKYIDGINPIILKELKETLFIQVEVPKRDIKIIDELFDHTDWKERLAAVNALKENITGMSNANEATSVLYRKTKDQNLSVLIATVECIRNGKINHPDCIRGILERFKDRKIALSNLIKETIQAVNPDINILIDSLSNKNPDVRIGVLECLKFYPSLCRIGEVGKLLEDSSADVRKCAFEVLSQTDDWSDLTELQRNKMKKQTKTAPEAKPVEVSTVIPKQALKIASKPATPRKSEISTGNGSAYDQSGRDRVINTFKDKYPQLFDKDWNKRFVCVQEKKDQLLKEGASNLFVFIVESKETNFNVLKVFMSMLATFEDLSGLRSELFSYLASKISEPKLKESISELFGKLGEEHSVDYILQCISQNKTGKKFVSLLEVLTLVVTQPALIIDDFVTNTKVFGIQDRRAFQEFAAHYTSLKKPAIEVAGCKPSSSITPCKNSTTSNIFKIPLSELRQKGSIADISAVFTPEFVTLLQTSTYSAVEMLEKLDVCSISDLIIGLYCQYKLPSPYFNSFILHLISRRYILSEKEARFLVHHAIENSMDSEIDLMDRIYPATKLYRILRENGSQASLNAIFNLIRKYKNLPDLVVNDIEIAVKSNEDFIAFSFDVDKVLDLKREIKLKFEGNIQSEPVQPDVLLPFKTQLNVTEERLEYQNSMQEDFEEDDLEDSIIVHKTMICDRSNMEPSTSHPASVLYAPSVASIDNVVKNTTDIDLGIPDCASVKYENHEEAVHNQKDTSRQESIDEFFVPPSRIEGADLSFEIERSLENISISTTPTKKKRHSSEVDVVLTSISDKNTATSTSGLEKLQSIIQSNPESIASHSNSILGSIMLRFLEEYGNQDFRNVVLSALLKFTRNEALCTNLKYETLKSVHKDLVPIVKEDDRIADVLINLCLNSGLHILKVYFDFLEDTNDILMRLIWRHSKKIKFTSVSVTAETMQIIDSFYEEKRRFLSVADNIVVKVCLLHLKECVAAFSDNLKQFGIGNMTDRIINLLIVSKDLNLDEIRKIFRG